jgi:hypothetical protein
VCGYGIGEKHIQNLVRILEGKRPHRKVGVNGMIILKFISGIEDVNWNHLAQDVVHWRPCMTQ